MTIYKKLQSGSTNQQRGSKMNINDKKYEISGSEGEEKDLDEFIQYMKYKQEIQQKVTEAVKQGFQFYCKSCQQAFKTKEDVANHEQTEEHKNNCKTQIRHKINSYERSLRREARQKRKQELQNKDQEEINTQVKHPRRKKQGRRIRLKMNESRHRR